MSLIKDVLYVIALHSNFKTLGKLTCVSKFFAVTKQESFSHKYILTNRRQYFAHSESWTYYQKVLYEHFRRFPAMLIFDDTHTIGRRTVNFKGEELTQEIKRNRYNNTLVLTIETAGLEIVFSTKTKMCNITFGLHEWGFKIFKGRHNDFVATGPDGNFLMKIYDYINTLFYEETVSKIPSLIHYFHSLNMKELMLEFKKE